MTRHNVKVEPRWFERIRDNEKFAEVLYDDRDYQTGDTIRFTPTDVDDCLSWPFALRSITHVLRACDGLEDGYVVLSLADPRVGQHARTIADLREERDRLARSNRGLRGVITRLRNGSAQ